MDVQQLLAAFQKTAAVEEAKAVVAPVASNPQTDPNAGHDKLASDLYAGGAIFGEGFANRVIEKFAAVAAGGGGPQQGSQWQKVTNQIAAQKGQNKGVPAVAGHQTAESAGALSGAPGVVNPAKALS
jgi:hypothetical protein